jgi:steroid 5-alpha reductase family enzyme
LNSYVNGWYLFTLSGGYPNRWLTDPRFVVGLLLFLTGFTINRQADRTLRHLRQCDACGYAIPYGGLYRWISCPNYLGEIVEWSGWALATWSLPGLAFAVWTAANLAPRAHSHHLWYREHFEDYPPQRKALLPGLW